MAVQLSFEKRVYASHPLVVAKESIDIGQLFYDQGQFEQALECYTTAFEIFQELYGEDHPDAATALCGRAEILCKLGRFGETLECCTKILQILQALSASNNPALADMLRIRGIVLFILGRTKEALSDLRDALNIYIRFFDSSHQEVVQTRKMILEVEIVAVVFIFYTYCKALFPNAGNF